MAAGTVTFAGTTIVQPSTGLFTFRRGAWSREIEFARLLRGNGRVAKDHGAIGAKHVLEVTYTNVVTTSVATYVSNLEALACPTSGQISSGTLLVKDAADATLASIAHCVLASVDLGDQALRAKTITVSDAVGTVVYDLKLTLTFEQVRR